MRLFGSALRWLVPVALLLGLCGPVVAQTRPSSAATEMPKRLRIALVPLDDRPVCLQYPQMLAGLAYAEVVTPPIALLGRFTTPGDADGVARWLRSQDWSTYDALIVSADMIAYGGLVASRVRRVDTATALARLRVLRHVHAARADLPIYGSSVIMRLAPTADGTNDAWRESLARHAELADGATSETEARDLAAATARIPPAALQDYMQARRRNRDVNLAAIDLVASGVISRLIVSQDDARPRGLHVSDREALLRRTRDAAVTDRVGVQPGADEVSMLLLARAVLDLRRLSPTVRTLYSTEKARTAIAPYEDRPLHETVRFQLLAAGATVPDGSGAEADVDLFVFASRDESAVATSFATQITRAVAAGRGAIVADVDMKGDVQGASAELTNALLAANAFPRLLGYASWNTAGNTVGTAIAHGLLAWAGAAMGSRCTSPAWTSLADAQVTFMLHRLVNDHAYQGVARPALNRELRAAARTPDWVRTHAAELADTLRPTLEAALARYATSFTATAWTPTSRATSDLAVQVSPPRDLVVSLPWGRTFEAALAFDVQVAGLSGPARKLPVCTVVAR